MGYKENLTERMTGVKIDEKNSLIKKMMEIEDATKTDNIQFEKQLSEILIPLLKHEEYIANFTHGPGDMGIDILAERKLIDQDKTIKLGIECKNSHVSARDIYASFGMSMLNNFDKLLIVTNRKVNKKVQEIIQQTEPISIEILDLEGLKRWIGKIETESDINTLEIQEILKAISKKFASLVADDPMNLYKLEWRDIERMIAEIFDGMGFHVKLTPSSKDGGKDIILQCTINGEKNTYIVEIKHWRSGQKVGKQAVKDFLNVIVTEKRESGLYLSTFGYCDNAFQSLSEIERKKLRFGDKEKIVSLCQTYLKITSGMWSPAISLPEILCEKTLN